MSNLLFARGGPDEDLGAEDLRAAFRGARPARAQEEGARRTARLHALSFPRR